MVIEKNGFGGQIAFSPKVENIPGTQVISGSAFAEKLIEQAMALGADVELENVTGVEKCEGIFKVTTEEGSVHEGKTVILALGVKHRTLGLPGEDGQELSLVAQINPYTTQAVAARIRDYLYSVNNTFPAASAVKKFYFTFDELAPPTAVKVSRAQLLKKIEAGQVKLVSVQQFQQELAQQEGESALLRQVIKIVAQVLEKEESQVTGQTHIFYDLGATSIQYFSILSALAEHFSITEYSSTDAYCYTPKEICEYIERKL